MHSVYYTAQSKVYKEGTVPLKEKVRLSVPLPFYRTVIFSEESSHYIVYIFKEHDHVCQNVSTTGDILNAVRMQECRNYN